MMGPDGGSGAQAEGLQYRPTTTTDLTALFLISYVDGGDIGFTDLLSSSVPDKNIYPITVPLPSWRTVNLLHIKLG
jgi:hypothetical protein